MIKKKIKVRKNKMFFAFEKNLKMSLVELRHYAIKTRSAAGRRVRKLLDGNKELPNMGKYGSIEQYLEAMSGSESGYLEAYKFPLLHLTFENLKIFLL